LTPAFRAQFGLRNTRETHPARLSVTFRQRQLDFGIVLRELQRSALAQAATRLQYRP
jgi:hypothetical protein